MLRVAHSGRHALGGLDRRSPAEVSGILAAVEAKVAALAEDPRIHQQRVRVKVAGRLKMLPAPTVAAIRAAEEATATYDDGLALTIAVAYGGHDEITDAVRALLRSRDRWLTRIPRP